MKKNRVIFTIISSLVIYALIVLLLTGTFGDFEGKNVIIIILAAFQLGLALFNSAAHQK